MILSDLQEKWGKHLKSTHVSMLLYLPNFSNKCHLHFVYFRVLRSFMARVIKWATDEVHLHAFSEAAMH